MSDRTAKHCSTTIARLVIDGRPPLDASVAESVLFDALSTAWPRGIRARFLLLPGGAVSAPWPTAWRGHVGWASTPSDVVVLVEEAKRIAPRLLSSRVRKAARGKIDALAFGIDFQRDATTGATAELIVLHHVASGRLVVTGKSLPYSNQRALVRFSDLRSHFTTVDGERVMMLGCHDLNLFSRRARSRQADRGVLSIVRDEMDHEVETFRPTVVLQLPHGTDTARTWTPSWNALREQAPTIREWASGIAFFNPTPGRDQRSTLDKVLARTRGPDAGLDIVYLAPRSAGTKRLPTGSRARSAK